MQLFCFPLHTLHLSELDFFHLFSFTAFGGVSITAFIRNLGVQFLDHRDGFSMWSLSFQPTRLTLHSQGLHFLNTLILMLPLHMLLCYACYPEIFLKCKFCNFPFTTDFFAFIYADSHLTDELPFVVHEPSLWSVQLITLFQWWAWIFQFLNIQVKWP